MAHLHPCPSCRRHLRLADEVCPFCGVSVLRDASSGALGRAAVLALALGSSAAACGTGQPATADPQQVTSDAHAQSHTVDAGVATDAATPEVVDDDTERLKMPYGAPPVRARLV